MSEETTPLKLESAEPQEEDLKNRVKELEALVDSLKHSLEASKAHEKRLLVALEEVGIDNEGQQLLIDESDSMFIENSSAPKTLKRSRSSSKLGVSNEFIASLIDRGGWLIGLLVFQSCSSFILSANEELLSDHPSIIFFLTMLVGAGGNAGNQAAVRVIRGIALGTLSKNTYHKFFAHELSMAAALSGLLGTAGLLRALLSFQTTSAETLAITVALMAIVFLSIIAGTALPMVLHFFGVDPAHSSTSIQVIMDITGVLITCIVATSILDTEIGKDMLSIFGISQD